jgi:hypothetical protein
MRNPEIMSTRVAPAIMEMINAKPSLPTPSDPSSHVAAS